MFVKGYLFQGLFLLGEVEVSSSHFPVPIRIFPENKYHVGPAVTILKLETQNLHYLSLPNQGQDSTN